MKHDSRDPNPRVPQSTGNNHCASPSVSEYLRVQLQLPWQRGQKELKSVQKANMPLNVPASGKVKELEAPQPTWLERELSLHLYVVLSI